MLCLIRYECDKCGRKLSANDQSRFIVRLEVFAAAGPLNLDAERPSDSREAMDRVLAKLATANPDDVEDQTYRVFRFDLCHECHRKLLERPLG